MKYFFEFLLELNVRLVEVWFDVGLVLIRVVIVFLEFRFKDMKVNVEVGV